MKTADFDYDLPPELISQHPVEPRDSARLMVLDRGGEELTHARFHELPRCLRPGDLLIFNDTRVIPARLLARKAGTGGRAELLMLKRRAPLTWEVLVGGHGITQGSVLEVEGATHDLSAGFGIELPSGTAHQARNDGPGDARFLVISSPPHQGDRRETETGES